ncbi:Uncharacterised protein [Vibrio cholerae]|nr:Uncharacterised protein [Vibrio cholerae]
MLDICCSNGAYKIMHFMWLQGFHVHHFVFFKHITDAS